MATFSTTVPSSRTPEATFAYLADFSTTQEWDPGIERATRVDTGPIGKGARFEIVSRFLGRDVVLTYEIVAYDAAARSLTLRGTNATTVSVDTITVADDASVHYQADLTLKGVGRLFDPVLGLMFNRIGAKAADGLRARLAA